MNSYGWLISKNHTELLQVGKNVFRILETKKDFIKRGFISGNYTQIDCLKSPFRAWSKKFLPLLEIQVKSLLTQSFPQKSWISKGKLQHLKLLIAPPNSPGQSPHRDGLSKDTFVIAFYLTDHSSTYLSIHPYLQETTFNKLTKKEMKQIPDEYWTDFVSMQVHAGDLSIFHEDVVHKGPANFSDQYRYVLFSVFTKEGYQHKDYNQYFPWDWFQQSEHFGSEKHIQSLKRNIAFAPWRHHGGKKGRRLRALCKSKKI